MIIARLRAALALSLKTLDPLVARLCRSRPNANEQQRGAPLKLCETAARNKGNARVLQTTRAVSLNLPHRT
jgi:hypothetical protein